MSWYIYCIYTHSIRVSEAKELVLFDEPKAMLVAQ